MIARAHARHFVESAAGLLVLCSLSRIASAQSASESSPNLPAPAEKAPAAPLLAPAPADTAPTAAPTVSASPPVTPPPVLLGDPSVALLMDPAGLEPPAPASAAPRYAFSLALGGGAFFVKTAALTRDHIGSPGTITADFGGSFARYAFARFGFGLAIGPDHAGFQQTVCPVNGGDCETRNSSILGGSVSLQAGPQVRVPLGGSGQMILAASLGYRGLWLSRQIDASCQNCQTQSLDISAGPFAAPELTFLYVTSRSIRHTGIGLRSEYEQFLSGDVTSALLFSIVVDFW
jgi:hypothetical protein